MAKLPSISGQECVNALAKVVSTLFGVHLERICTFGAMIRLPKLPSPMIEICRLVHCAESFGMPG
jgi:hypothetical protein